MMIPRTQAEAGNFEVKRTTSKLDHTQLNIWVVLGVSYGFLQMIDAMGACTAGCQQSIAP
jgi:hypothetical protein